MFGTLLLAAALGVYAEPGASPQVKAVQDRVLAGDAPLLKALVAVGAAEKPTRRDALEAAPAKQDAWLEQAKSHLVIVGLPTDGAVAARVKGYTYGLDPAHQELFRLGLGRFRGDVGVVETQFNPWLYSNRVNDTAKSTLMVRLSGTTPKGVALAAEAFAKGLNNGVVLGPGATRVETSILDLEPSDEPPPADILADFPARAGLVYAGWTQAPAQEYRAYLDWGATEEPRRVWRLKYLAADSLDSASGTTWANSPLPVAFGNAVTIAEFASPAATETVRAEIVKRKGGKEVLDYPKDEANYGPGEIRILSHGNYLVFDARRTK